MGVLLVFVYLLYLLSGLHKMRFAALYCNFDFQGTS